jgi:hypothetical protein
MDNVYRFNTLLTIGLVQCNSGHTCYYIPITTLPLNPTSKLHATIWIVPPQESVFLALWTFYVWYNVTKLVKCLHIFQSLFYEVWVILLRSTISYYLQITALWHQKSLFPNCIKMQMGLFYNVCAMYTSMLRNNLRSCSWGRGSGWKQSRMLPNHQG